MLGIISRRGLLRRFVSAGGRDKPSTRLLLVSSHRRRGLTSSSASDKIDGVDVVVMGDPRLRVPGKTVIESRFGTPELERTVDDLIATMKRLNGAGIAATQIGIPDRIFVVHGTGNNPRYPYKPKIPLTVFINPQVEILDKTPMDLIEGCLSVPGYRGQVQRCAKVKVRARRVDGSRFTVFAEGHAAGTLQHENDHLDGVVFPDIARTGPFGPEKLMTWDAFAEHYADQFLPYAEELNVKYPDAVKFEEGYA